MHHFRGNRPYIYKTFFIITLINLQSGSKELVGFIICLKLGVVYGGEHVSSKITKKTDRIK